ncbi:MAG TPA: hypothetical protein VGE93_20420, partial [Bryobacteraceae bacterium]
TRYCYRRDVIARGIGASGGVWQDAAEPYRSPARWMIVRGSSAGSAAKLFKSPGHDDHDRAASTTAARRLAPSISKL